MKDDKIMRGDWFFIGHDLVTIIEVTDRCVNCIRSVRMENGLSWGEIVTYDHEFVAKHETYRLNQTP